MLTAHGALAVYATNMETVSACVGGGGGGVGMKGGGVGVCVIAILSMREFLYNVF